MTGDPSGDQSIELRMPLDWNSPRWQADDAVAGDVERYRRSRIGALPRQRGALDRDGSVGARPRLTAGEQEDGPSD